MKKIISLVLVLFLTACSLPLGIQITSPTVPSVMPTPTGTPTTAPTLPPTATNTAAPTATPIIVPPTAIPPTATNSPAPTISTNWPADLFISTVSQTVTFNI